jgi:excisionase family DNA binding protein
MTSTIHDSLKIAYSVREACSATSLGRTTMYNHIKSGRLRTVRVGGRTIILADELKRFLSGEAA